MKTYGDDLDPKHLIAEAFKIDGITEEECRSIFLDWALSLPLGVDSVAALPQLLERHATEIDPEGHPMTQVMREGLQRMNAPRRRGGWRSRERGEM